MQLFALQFAPTWEDKDASHSTIERLLEAAEPAKGDLVVLPEMCDTGWSFNHKVTTTQDSLNWAGSVSKRLGIHLQVGYSELCPDGKGRNCTTIMRPDGTHGPVYRKMHPFSGSPIKFSQGGSNSGSEEDNFTRGETIVLDHVGEMTICPTICYDLRFPEFYRHGALAGAQVFSVIASWPVQRAAHWRALAIARAIENQAYVVAVNRIGSDPSMKYAGGSMIISPQGEILADAGGSEGAIRAKFDLAELLDWRERFPVLQDLQRDLLGAARIEFHDP
jgi:predicted amidohydrolase